MNEQARGIINALLQLANSGTFSCDLEGAEKIAGLRQAALRTVDELTKLIEAEATPEEPIDNE